MKDVESGLSIARYYAMHSIRRQKGAFQKLPPGSMDSTQEATVLFPGCWRGGGAE